MVRRGGRDGGEGRSGSREWQQCFQDGVANVEGLGWVFFKGEMQAKSCEAGPKNT